MNAYLAKVEQVALGAHCRSDQWSAGGRRRCGIALFPRSRWERLVRYTGLVIPATDKTNSSNAGVSETGGLHLLEGFFGRSWPWPVRRQFVPFLREHGFSSYLYAPKDDPYLRRQWSLPWPQAVAREVKQTADACHGGGLQFGVGLSPFEIYRQFGAGEQAQLVHKVDELNQFDVDILCLLFDDMRGDLPGLANTQIEVAHRVADRARAARIILCPTYYSTDPVLEEVFGARPSDYWSTLAAHLDPQIDLFWTGPQVCSTAYDPADLVQVAQLLGRQPVIWDNYPVNDGAVISRYLHLRPFNYRQAVASGARGHAVNPMNQPWLSRIALCTAHYRQDWSQAQEQQLFEQACVECCGALMGRALIQDVTWLQDVGLDKMGAEKKDELRARYAAFVDDANAGPYARELLDWLNEQYAFDPACLTG